MEPLKRSKPAILLNEKIEILSKGLDINVLSPARRAALEAKKVSGNLKGKGKSTSPVKKASPSTSTSTDKKVGKSTPRKSIPKPKTSTPTPETSQFNANFAPIQTQTTLNIPINDNSFANWTDPNTKKPQNPPKKDDIWGNFQ